MHWRLANLLNDVMAVMCLAAAVGLTACASKDRAGSPGEKAQAEQGGVSTSGAGAGSNGGASGEAGATSSGDGAVGATSQDLPPVPGARVEAISLLGEKLYIVDQPSALTDKRLAELAAAQAAYDRDPHNEEAIIWLGRRLAYLGRFNDAIAVYTNGLAIHPDSARILRHRGHRYITIRLFNLAQNDLERASILVAGQSDEVEQDGQPNARNAPTSTLQTNIYYHLGLAQYLTGDYSAAAKSFRACLERSKNDDMRTASAYWLYLSLRRFNRMSEAAALLKDIHPNMDIIENHSYQRLLLVFKGELSPEQAAQVDATGATLGDVTIDEATVGYGIGVWHEMRGERGMARMKWRGVIDTTNWAAFGFIASEVDTAGGR